MNASLRSSLSLTTLLLLATICHGEGPYVKSGEIPVGGEGGWDYLSVDAAQHRLYVSHATKVVVIDTRTDAVVGEIADTPGVHGIALAPELDRGFVSNGKANNVSVVELSTLKTLTKISTGKNPDAILFEPGKGEVYAFNGRDASATVFAADSGKVVATIPVGGKPEFAQADPKAGRVYLNVEDKSEVVVIDTATHAVLQHWPIAPGEEASGMDIDLSHHLLFIGCSNAKIIVMDSGSGRVVADIPAGVGIDAAAFDPGTGYVFSSNGRDGTVTVARADAEGHFSVVQTLVTEPGARTMTVDPVSHKIYLASAKFQPAGEGQRPRIVPGSMKVLVFGLSASK